MLFRIWGLNRFSTPQFNQKSRLQKVITYNNTCIKNIYPHPRAIGKGFEPKITAFINTNFISKSKKKGNIVHFLHPHYFHKNLSRCAVTIHDFVPILQRGHGQIPPMETKQKELQELGYQDCYAGWNYLCAFSICQG